MLQSLQEQLLSNPNAHLLVKVNLTGRSDAGVPVLLPLLLLLLPLLQLLLLLRITTTC